MERPKQRLPPKRAVRFVEPPALSGARTGVHTRPCSAPALLAGGAKIERTLARHEVGSVTYFLNDAQALWLFAKTCPVWSPGVVELGHDVQKMDASPHVYHL